MKFFFMNLRIILFFGGICDIIILNKYVQKARTVKWAFLTRNYLSCLSIGA